jgi:hypothetical protein
MLQGWKNLFGPVVSSSVIKTGHNITQIT